MNTPDEHDTRKRQIEDRMIQAAEERDEPINDIWKDPMVMEALKDGRDASDIQVLPCPECNRWGYWNEGSHFSCRFCERTWYVCSEDQVPRPGLDMALDGFTSLADTVTETTNGYHNQTRNYER